MLAGVQWDSIVTRGWSIEPILRNFPPRSSRQYATEFTVNNTPYPTPKCFMCCVMFLASSQRLIFHIKRITKQCSAHFIIIHFLRVQVFRPVVFCLTGLVLNNYTACFDKMFALDRCAYLVSKSQRTPLPILFWCPLEDRYSCRAQGLHGISSGCDGGSGSGCGCDSGGKMSGGRTKYSTYLYYKSQFDLSTFEWMHICMDEQRKKGSAVVEKGWDSLTSAVPREGIETDRQTDMVYRVYRRQEYWELSLNNAACRCRVESGRGKVRERVGERERGKEGERGRMKGREREGQRVGEGEIGREGEHSC